ncbi:MAG: DUF3775 domain-containing protein [Wenzhouxiangellaceae bacterium]
MLEVSTATICRLIDLAEEFHALQDVDFTDNPGRMGDDFTSEALEPHQDNPFLAEFRSVVDDLNPDEQQQIVALLWLGRGDYEKDEWSDALEYAAEAWTPTTGDYLIAHPMVADHLSTGLEQFGLSCED